MFKYFQVMITFHIVTHFKKQFGIIAEEIKYMINFHRVKALSLENKNESMKKIRIRYNVSRDYFEFSYASLKNVYLKYMVLHPSFGR